MLKAEADSNKNMNKDFKNSKIKKMKLKKMGEKQEIVPHPLRLLQQRPCVCVEKKDEKIKKN